MSTNNVENVSTGKPKIGGAVFRAPLGAKLPTSASETLDEAFKNLGYCGEDGLVNSNSPSFEDHKAWGGDIVYSSQTEKPDTFNFTLIEILNPEVLKTVYGENNVEGTDLATGIHVEATSEEVGECSYVFDMILRGNVLKRIVVPRAKLTELGDITYSDDELAAYEPTITCYPSGTKGKTHDEYMLSESDPTGE